MIRVGVIGVGAMGRHHARIYSELPGVELVGVADLDSESLSAVASRYRTKGFNDYQELLRQSLDAISIVVPTSVHKTVALEAANAGLNMLIEKPIADTIPNAKEIIKACQKNRVKLMIGHVERFNPILPVVKKAIENLHVISIDMVRVGPLPPRIKDVGIVVDLGTHDIDLLRYLTSSDFKKVRGMLSKGPSGKEDTAVLSFEMENGVLAHITTNWLTPFKIREINIAAREKYIKGWFIEQKVAEYKLCDEADTYTVKELKVPFGEPLRLELAAFLKSIAGGESPPVTGEDGLRALEVAVQCLNLGECS
ncbi:MAG: Gfo/Idh/MocA family oxidoreductase [Chloroflexi bacterium]|nr:Gfo/Idh/MocA family oxidoreductase [Chloroflexota bacterium]